MKLFKIFIIVLKITEFVSLTLAAANIGYFIKATSGEDRDLSWDPLNLKQSGRLEFFLFTTTVGVFIVAAMTLMLVTGLREKISENQTVTEIHAIWALMLLVSSVQLLRTMNDLNSQDSGFDNVSTCDSYRDTGYQCRQLMTGVISGFVATILFLLDAGVHILTSIRTDGVQFKQAIGGTCNGHFP